VSGRWSVAAEFELGGDSLMGGMASAGHRVRSLVLGRAGRRFPKRCWSSARPTEPGSTGRMVCGRLDQGPWWPATRALQPGGPASGSQDLGPDSAERGLPHRFCPGVAIPGAPWLECSGGSFSPVPMTPCRCSLGAPRMARFFPGPGAAQRRDGLGNLVSTAAIDERHDLAELEQIRGSARSADWGSRPTRRTPANGWFREIPGTLPEHHLEKSRGRPSHRPGSKCRQE